MDRSGGSRRRLAHAETPALWFKSRRFARRGGGSSVARLPVVEAAGHGVGRRAPGGRVIGIDVRLEVVADLDEARVGADLQYLLAAILTVEILKVKIKALIGEKLAPLCSHPMRHLSLVELTEELSDFGR